MHGECANMAGRIPFAEVISGQFCFQKLELHESLLFLITYSPKLNHVPEFFTDSLSYFE
jgi:hypothetical protein